MIGHFLTKTFNPSVLREVTKLKDRLASERAEYRELESKMKFLQKENNGLSAAITKCIDVTAKQCLLRLFRKNDQLFIMTISQFPNYPQNEIDIYIHDPATYKIVGRLFAELKKQDTIVILNLQANQENIGLGSLMLNELFNCIESQNVMYSMSRSGNNKKIKAITGDIMGPDFEEVEKVKTFYEKHGFKVSIDYQNRIGKIERPI